ncbi:MAG TPA: SAM-dependent methyltransferase [Gemmatimonadaceae bacterium]|nr:SAM-dependent methyltransferase [Gemmatimonadaceae bacterium]
MVERGASRSIRNALKQRPWLRSTYYLSIALRQMVADQWKNPSSFDSIFSDAEDPWNSTSESEQHRFATTLGVLAKSGRARFPTAVEIGCAEGIFTSLLIPYCNDILGLDYSEVALARARTRFDEDPQVRFRQWDMRTGKIDGQFELVVAMGVLTSLYRPTDVRRACRMIVDAVRPGGFLLFSDVRQSRVFERAWWGPLVLRGGEQIRRLLTRAYGLEIVASADSESHVFALLRRPSHPRRELDGH